jgi:hypothetical protein
VTNQYHQVQIDQLPEAPPLENIQVSAAPFYDTSGVILNWPAMTGAVQSYHIFRDGQYAGQTTGVETTFINHWLPTHQLYSYVIKAFDINGVLIGESNPVQSYAGDSVAPTQPGNVAAVANDAQGFNISWTPSTDAVGVTYYVIYENGVAITIRTEPFYAANWLSAGSWHYQIVAYDGAGNASLRSEIMTVER